MPTFSSMMDLGQDLKMQIVGTSKGQLYKFFSLKIILRRMKQKKSRIFYFYFLTWKYFFFFQYKTVYLDKRQNTFFLWLGIWTAWAVPLHMSKLCGLLLLSPSEGRSGRQFTVMRRARRSYCDTDHIIRKGLSLGTKKKCPTNYPTSLWQKNKPLRFELFH